MLKFYRHLSEMRRLLFWIVVGELGAFVLLSFCFFIGHYDIPLGICLGSIISVINFILLEKQSEKCTSRDHPKMTAAGFYLLRYFFYALGLTLALVMMKFVFPLFNVFAVFGAYLIPKIVIFIFNVKGDKYEKN